MHGRCSPGAHVSTALPQGTECHWERSAQLCRVGWVLLWPQQGEVKMQSSLSPRFKTVLSLFQGTCASSVNVRHYSSARDLSLGCFCPLCHSWSDKSLLIRVPVREKCPWDLHSFGWLLCGLGAPSAQPNVPVGISPMSEPQWAQPRHSFSLSVLLFPCNPFS